MSTEPSQSPQTLVTPAPAEPSALTARMGASVLPSGVQFRVWAPDATRVDVQFDDVRIPLSPEPDGLWSATVPGIGAGLRYRYRIDGEGAFPDPYARSQPEGPHGPSEVVAPDAFAWRSGAWRGLSPHGLAIYECHVGAATPEGTFDALIGQLDDLRALGVNAIELMPVAEWPGTRNWGYDGVDLFAPSHVYGGPDGLKRLVDAAHARGLGVILDVVYNHLGPDGNYLARFAKDYLTDRYATPWGDAVNFDGERSAMVRKLAVDNACYWIDEYHVDGLRLDATFEIIDHSPRHILAAITAAARASAGERGIVMIAETDENDARYVRPVEQSGFGFDAVWADDFHHVAHVYAVGERDGYYANYEGTLDELARTIDRGWLYEGQAPRSSGAPRGTPADGLPARAFVYSLQNHDQVGNRAFGRRFSHLVGTDASRTWAALLLLLPYTPLIFMGQEFAASSRFYYFTDHQAELGHRVSDGRRREFARFAGFDDASQREIPDPQDETTFLASKLRLEERHEGVGEEFRRMFAELLALRRRDDVLRLQDRERMHATAAGDLLLVHLWHGREHRLIAANFGVAIDASPASAGVPATLADLPWRTLFSSDERRFGGDDDGVRLDGDFVSLPPQTVALLAARRPLPPARLLGRVRRIVRRRA